MADFRLGLRLRAYTRSFSNKFRRAGEQVSQSYGRMVRAAREARTRISQSNRETERSAGSLGERLGGLKNQILAFAGAAVSIYGVQRAFQAVLGTGGQFETLRTQLDAVMGSVEGGEDAFEWIKEFTKETPFQLEQVTDSFVKMKAFGLDPMDGTMRKLVDQASKLGGSQETLQGVITAVGQAWAKQKLQGEEILQLVERGVPVWELLEEATGKNVQQLQALSSAGKLGRKEISLLIDEIGKSSEGAAAAQMTTWNGLVSNLKDSWAQFLDEVAQSGVLDYFKTQITALNKTIKEMARSGELKKLAQNISDGFVTMAKAIKGSIAFIYEWGTAITAAAAAAAAFKVAKLARGFYDSGKAALEAATQTRAYTSALAAAEGGLGRFIPRLSTLTKFLKGGAIGAAAVGIWNVAEGLREANNRLYDSAQKQKEQLRALKAEGVELRQEYAGYRDTVIKTGEEVQKLSKWELERYNESLEGLRGYMEGQAKVLVAEKNMGKEVKEQQQALTQKFQSLKKAQQESAKAMEEMAGSAEKELAPAVLEVISEFETLIGKGKSARTAIGEILKDINLQDYEKLSALGTALQEIQDEGHAAANAIRDELANAMKDMSSGEIDRFVTQIQAGFGEGEKGARAMATVMDAELAVAFEKAGLDITEFKEGVTSAGKDARANFQRVVEKLEEVGSSAEKSGQFVAGAFNKALNDTETLKGVENLKNAIKNAWEKNLIGPQKYREALEALKTKEEELAKEAGKGADRYAKSWKKATETLLETRRIIQGVTEDQSDQTEETERNTESTEENTGKKAENKDAADDQSDATRRNTRETDSNTDSLKENNAARRTAVTLAGKSAAELQKSGEKIAAYSEEMYSRLRRSGLTFVDSWWAAHRKMEDALAAHKKQKAQADALTQSLEAQGGATRENIWAAEQAAKSMRWLGEQDLAPMRNAIASARREIQSLNDSLDSTVNSLQDELDRMNENYTAIEQRRYEVRKAALEDQLEKARDYGDREAVGDAKKALSLLEEVNKRNMAEARQREKRDQGRRQKETTRPDPRLPDRQPQRQTIELKFRDDSGRQQSVGVDESDVQTLLRLLEQAGVTAA